MATVNYVWNGYTNDDVNNVNNWVGLAVPDFAGGDDTLRFPAGCTYGPVTNAGAFAALSCPTVTVDPGVTYNFGTTGTPFSIRFTTWNHYGGGTSYIKSLGGALTGTIKMANPSCVFELSGDRIININLLGGRGHLTSSFAPAAAVTLKMMMMSNPNEDANLTIDQGASMAAGTLVMQSGILVNNVTIDNVFMRGGDVTHNNVAYYFGGNAGHTGKLYQMGGVLRYNASVIWDVADIIGGYVDMYDNPNTLAFAASAPGKTTIYPTAKVIRNPDRHTGLDNVITYGDGFVSSDRGAPWSIKGSGVSSRIG